MNVSYDNLPPYVNPQTVNHFISEALVEDVGPGDYSTLAIIPKDKTDKARLLVKEDGIIAGVRMAEFIFNHVDPNLEMEIKIQDGQPIKVGDEAFYVSGSAQSILTAERLVLNCMQRMSGIATLTHEMVEQIKGTHAKLLDTRKTTPNFRMCEKWAVVIGGGHNHRYGLYDMIMLKDNHIDYAGGITQAVSQTKEYLKENNLNLKIEVETRNLEEVKEALDCGVDRIMLDNFLVSKTKEAVDFINHRSETEASGGITLESIREIAETGVDYISSGALTHSAKNIDLSLKAM